MQAFFSLEVAICSQQQTLVGTSPQSVGACSICSWLAAPESNCSRGPSVCNISGRTCQRMGITSARTATQRKNHNCIPSASIPLCWHLPPIVGKYSPWGTACAARSKSERSPPSYCKPVQSERPSQVEHA